MKTLEQEFHNPSAAYRGKPFWAWNGKLEEQELLRQIDVLHEMGFGGFSCTRAPACRRSIWAKTGSD